MVLLHLSGQKRDRAAGKPARNPATPSTNGNLFLQVTSIKWSRFARRNATIAAIPSRAPTPRHGATRSSSCPKSSPSSQNTVSIRFAARAAKRPAGRSHSAFQAALLVPASQRRRVGGDSYRCLPPQQTRRPRIVARRLRSDHLRRRGHWLPGNSLGRPQAGSRRGCRFHSQTLAEKPRGRQALATLYAATQGDVCLFSRQRSPTAPAVANFCVKPTDIGAHRAVGTCLSTPGAYLHRDATEYLRTARN